METVKPVIYVRSKPKDYGTSKLVEGKVEDGMRVVMVDDVATTGGSVIRGIRALRDAGAEVSDAYVVVNRLEGAAEALEAEGVKMHSLTDILQVTKIMSEEGLVSRDILDGVKAQIDSR